MNTASGVSGDVQYDLDIYCFNDEHDGQLMHPTDERSDKGNTIFECDGCGNRRAANAHVVPVGGGS